MLSKFIFHIGAFIVGFILGVLACNWNYFQLDRSISISDLFICIISALVAVYIGSNIQKAIANSQNRRSFLVEEIKKFLLFIEKFEVWIEHKSLPFEEAKFFFKKATTLIGDNRKIFSENRVVNEDSFITLLSDLNELKRLALSKSPINGNILLNIVEADELDKKYRKVKSELLTLILKN